MISMKCQRCGAEFETKSKCSKYCEKCRAEMIKARSRAQAEANKAIKKVGVCPNCGKEFVKSVRVKTYCSDKCSRAARRRKAAEVRERERQEEARKRVDEKMKAEKNRQAKLSARDAVVSQYTDEMTGFTVQWRGMRCVAGGHPQARP